MFAVFLFFFFNDTATTEIYTLSLHDALPICHSYQTLNLLRGTVQFDPAEPRPNSGPGQSERDGRSEEHTSELQSLAYLVCRLLLEKKKKSQSRHPSCHEHNLAASQSQYARYA